MGQVILPCPTLPGVPCLRCSCAAGRAGHRGAPCLLPAPCLHPSPLGTSGLFHKQGTPRGGSQTPSAPRSSHPRLPLRCFSPHSPPSLPASGSRCRAAGTGGHCSGLPCSGAGLPPLSPSSSLLGSHPWVCPGFSLMLPSSALPFPAFSCFSNLLEPLRSGFDPSAQAANWLGSKMSRVHFS